MQTYTEPEYEAVEQRYNLLYTHKIAKRIPNFDINHYNLKGYI